MVGIKASDSFARQDLSIDIPIVIVGLWIEGQWFEGASVLNGRGFKPAVLQATSRALDFPDADWVELERHDLTDGLTYRGVRLRVIGPDCEVHEADHIFEDGLKSRSVAAAMAFAKILCGYYEARGIQPGYKKNGGARRCL